MKTNLNELVDAVFKGVILVIASSLVTLAFLFVRPGRSLRRVFRGMRERATEQVTPRVLLFLLMVALLLAPIFLPDLVYPAALPEDGYYGIATNALGKAISDEATRSLVPAMISGIAAVVVFEMGTMLLAMLWSGWRRPVAHMGHMFAIALMVAALILLLPIGYLNIESFEPWVATLAWTLLFVIPALAGAPLSFAAIRVIKPRLKKGFWVLGAMTWLGTAVVAAAGIFTAVFFTQAFSEASSPNEELFRQAECRLDDYSSPPRMIASVLVSAPRITPYRPFVDDYDLVLEILVADPATGVTKEQGRLFANGQLLDGEPLPIPYPHNGTRMIHAVYELSRPTADYFRENSAWCELASFYSAAGEAVNVEGSLYGPFAPLGDFDPPTSIDIPIDELPISHPSELVQPPLVPGDPKDQPLASD